MEETNAIKYAPGLALRPTPEMMENAVAEMAEYKKLMGYYSCAILEVETKFKVLNVQFSAEFDRNPIEGIETRLKTPKSIVEKMQRLGKEPTPRNIERELNDVAGIRVICSFIDDIYRLADMLARQDDVYVVRIKDYIKNPKPGGYRSLHMIIEVPIFLSNEKRIMRAEVQLRTIAMDFWASLEHKLRYKKDIPEESAQEITARLLACAQSAAQTDNEMMEIRKMIEAERLRAKK